jgi:hypothetical protein
MRWKLIALSAFAVGYVLGAHAGRHRYEQIRTLATRVKDDPRVQDGAQHTAAVVQQGMHAAATAVRQEASVIREKVSGPDDEDGLADIPEEDPLLGAIRP